MSFRQEIVPEFNTKRKSLIALQSLSLVSARWRQSLLQVKAILVLIYSYFQELSLPLFQRQDNGELREIAVLLRRFIGVFSVEIVALQRRFVGELEENRIFR